MDELVVVAMHGPDWIGQCLDSLHGTPILVLDTGDTHPSGAYVRAYREFPADRYLFIQDSMTALGNPLPWFRDQWPGRGAVAWGRFPMQWDANQKERVEAQYPSVPEPLHGIFGPVFYVDCRSLEYLDNRGLLPATPTNRIEAQGTERAWAYAFAAAGLPVVGPEWDSDQMASGFGPFKKVWANRP